MTLATTAAATPKARTATMTGRRRIAMGLRIAMGRRIDIG
jgi:hypothetical protein